MRPNMIYVPHQTRFLLPTKRDIHFMQNEISAPRQTRFLFPAKWDIRSSPNEISAPRQTRFLPYHCKIGATRLPEPRRPEVFNSPRQILTLLNKVPGYWLQGETDLANKPRILQIFPHSKFGINWTAALKGKAKKFLWPKFELFGHNFWASGPIDPKFWVWKKSACFSACLQNQFLPGVNNQGLYLVS